MTRHQRKIISSFEQIAWHLTSLSEETTVSIDPDSSDKSLSDINVIVENRDTLSQIMEQLQAFLPAVTAYLSEHSRLEELVAFSLNS